MSSEPNPTPAAIHMRRLRERRRAEGKCQRCGHIRVDNKCYHCVPLSLRQKRKREHKNNYTNISLRNLKKEPKNLYMVEWMKKYGCSTMQLSQVLKVSQRMIQLWCIEGEPMSQDYQAKLKAFMYQIEQQHEITNNEEA